MAAARPEPIPVFAEMSSVNPVLLLPEALKARGSKVAAELGASVTQGAGQFCTKPGLVIALRSPEFDGFLKELTQLINAQPTQTMLNAGGLCNYADGLAHLHDHPHIHHRAGHPQEGGQAHPQLFEGQLTATLIADTADLDEFAELIPLLEMKAGRLLLNGYPTGVEVCDAMVHGGPYPATSDARGSSVGTLAINRNQAIGN